MITLVHFRSKFSCHDNTCYEYLNVINIANLYFLDILIKIYYMCFVFFIRLFCDLDISCLFKTHLFLNVLLRGRGTIVAG